MTRPFSNEVRLHQTTKMLAEQKTLAGHAPQLFEAMEYPASPQRSRSPSKHPRSPQKPIRLSCTPPAVSEEKASERVEVVESEECSTILEQIHKAFVAKGRGIVGAPVGEGVLGKYPRGFPTLLGQEVEEDTPGDNRQHKQAACTRRVVACKGDAAQEARTAAPPSLGPALLGRCARAGPTPVLLGHRMGAERQAVAEGAAQAGDSSTGTLHARTWEACKSRLERIGGRKIQPRALPLAAPEHQVSCGGVGQLSTGYPVLLGKEALQEAAPEVARSQDEDGGCPHTRAREAYLLRAERITNRHSRPCIPIQPTQQQHQGAESRTFPVLLGRETEAAVAAAVPASSASVGPAPLASSFGSP